MLDNILDPLTGRMKSVKHPLLDLIEVSASMRDVRVYVALFAHSTIMMILHGDRRNVPSAHDVLSDLLDTVT